MIKALHIILTNASINRRPRIFIVLISLPKAFWGRFIVNRRHAPLYGKPVIMVENGSATPAYAHEILGDINTMQNESKCRRSTMNQIIQ